MSCAEPGAKEFAQEPAPGDYKTIYTFADGQIQTQAVGQITRGTVPSWAVSGITDFDVLGRNIRTYKIQFLPSACPGPGTWCDSQQISGDPLRTGIAEIQQAYDVQGRVIRTYGPGWPRCSGDTSAPVMSANGLPTADLMCDTPASGIPAVNDVTKFNYPRPGETVTIDANNIPTRVNHDVRGLVTRFEEYIRPPGSASPYAFVSRTYDALGRAIGSSDQDNNTSLNTYDALSRLTSSTDPDLGRTTYQYDLRSQLTDRISASGEKMHQEYDPLGRAVQTDYLRPLPPRNASTSPSNPTQVKYPSGAIPIAVQPDIPKLDPMKYWPDPPQEWQEVSISQDGGQLTLPFEARFSVFGETAVRSAAQPEAISNRQEHDYRFAEGTAIGVTADGQLLFGDANVGTRSRRAAHSSSPNRAIFIVLSPNLGLNSKSVRFSVTGTKGNRQLLVEWVGSLAKLSGQPAIVRATITEANSKKVESLVRYDYVKVPANFPAVASVRLVDGSSSFEASLDSESSPSVGPNTSFSFNGATDPRDSRCDLEWKFE